ncbi:UDP-glucose 4-epimerase GalE [uncultured Ilyobacter sp.]|uniref:UDP-glucose 4-epimerase GalE n=1 Tax=uncultured Ilyobacter sp. TaxID=544433 RepID=UPI002AA771DC|nr:UDP-glucose 4-epimerase GalE [uncultured Ilyobacter sp.]
MRVLVTGGAGYIGSHAVVELLDGGYEVVVLDNLETGYIELVDSRAKFYRADLREKESLRNVFKKEKIDVVMNFAAYIKVGESVSQPNKYYENNTGGVLNLLEVMKEFNVKHIVFSSTAAVYGEVSGKDLVTENFVTQPINPYGMSKFMAETIIKDSSSAYDMNYVIFRYFNVAGAHEKYPIGQMGEGMTSLIPVVLEAAKGERDKVEVFGDTYNTKDGTGVRDFIHVTDLAKAHVMAINKLKKGESGLFNLGNGNGFSVIEILEAARRVTGREIPSVMSERRLGDPACVVACSQRANQELGWEPKYINIDDIIRTAWDWYKSR